MTAGARQIVRRVLARLGREAMALGVAAAGAVGVFALVLAMNGAPPKKPPRAAQAELQMTKAPKRKTPPKRRKPKSKPRRKARASGPKAPLPNLGSALSGVDLGIPGLGGAGLDADASDLVGDTDTSDLVMSAGAVDRKAAPMRGNPPPRYPARAARDRVTGRVMLRIVVGADGATRSVEVQSADPPGVFEEAAVEAVQGWRWEPAIYRGQPVQQLVTLPLRFDRGGA